MTATTREEPWHILEVHSGTRAYCGLDRPHELSRNTSIFVPRKDVCSRCREMRSRVLADTTHASDAILRLA